METIILSQTEPKYLTSKDRAMELANTVPGKLWKRKPGVPDCVKPWAFGELPESRLDLYDLHSVNGRQA